MRTTASSSQPPSGSQPAHQPSTSPSPPGSPISPGMNLEGRSSSPTSSPAIASYPTNLLEPKDLLHHQSSGTSSPRRQVMDEPSPRFLPEPQAPLPHHRG